MLASFCFTGKAGNGLTIPPSRNFAPPLTYSCEGFWRNSYPKPLSRGSGRVVNSRPRRVTSLCKDPNVFLGESALGCLRWISARANWLQEQPFQVLAMLLEHGQEVDKSVSGPQPFLQVFARYDFDQGLNTATNKAEGTKR